MCIGRARIQFDGALKFGLGTGPIPLVKEFYRSERGVGSGQRRIERDRAGRRLQRFQPDL